MKKEKPIKWYEALLGLIGISSLVMTFISAVAIVWIGSNFMVNIFHSSIIILMAVIIAAQFIKD